jgi:hypothetical protein
MKSDVNLDLRKTAAQNMMLAERENKTKAFVKRNRRFALPQCFGQSACATIHGQFCNALPLLSSARLHHRIRPRQNGLFHKNREGTVFEQCSEICGTLDSGMPYFPTTTRSLRS